MARYALINNGNEEIIKEETREFSQVELANLARKFGPDKATRIVPSVRLDDPAYDPATQALTGYGPPTIEADRVTRVRSVRDLTADELEANDTRAKAAAVVAALKAGTGTSLQRLERVEKTLAYLVKTNFL